MYKLSKKEREFRERTRGRYAPEPAWYCVMTHCGRERRVRDRVLLDFGDDGAREVLLPEIKSNGHGRKTNGNLPDLLFSSYVFLYCTMSDNLYMSVHDYPDVFQILGRAYRIPSIIDETEITHLKGVLETNPIPRLSSRLNIGSPAVVTKGIMEGMRGRVVEMNAKYIKLET
jgi:transcription antitermination factor NusG